VVVFLTGFCFFITEKIFAFLRPEDQSVI
jgi:hypothetical protein